MKENGGPKAAVYDWAVIWFVMLGFAATAREAQACKAEAEHG